MAYEGNDDSVIGNVNGGEALIGFSVTDGNRNRHLIKVPTGCRLMGPTQPRKTLDLTFRCKNEFEQHFKQAKESKFSMHAGASFLDITLEAGYSSSSQKSSENSRRAMVEEACVVRVAYIPIKSFRIARNQMFLTKEVEEDALLVDSSRKAQVFLRKYNSHVFDGTYHLGGAFYQGMSIKAAQVTSSHMLEDAARRSLGLSAGYNMLFQGSIAMDPARSSSVSRSDIEEKFSNEAFSFTLGPNAQTLEEFETKMWTQISEWRIIHRSKEDVFVGVWELMINSGNDRLREPARIILEEWQSSVSTIIQEIPEVLQMLEDSKIYESASTNSTVEYKPMGEDEDSESEEETQVPLQKRYNIKPADLLQSLQNQLREGNMIHDGVVRAIRNCISDSDDKQVKEVAKLYGFTKEGNWAGNTYLTKEQVACMIQELQHMNKPKQRRRDIVPVVKLSDNNEDFWNLHMQTSSNDTQYSYVGDIVVDRPLQSIEKEGKRIIDCLRHRIQPFSSAPSITNVASWWGSDIICSTSDEKLKQSVPLIETLVETLENASFLAQISLCKLLLDQRFSIPLIFPSTKGSKKSLRQVVDALQFFEVHLGNQKIQLLADDTSLFRVVFVSSKSQVESENAAMASQVSNCNFISSYSAPSVEIGAPLVEIGVGFVPSKNDEKKYLPYICMHVVGDYNKLKGFITSFANLIIEETGQTTTGISEFMWECSTQALRKRGKILSGAFNQVKMSLVALVSHQLDEFVAGNKNSNKNVDKLKDLLQQHKFLRVHEYTIADKFSGSVSREELKLQQLFKDGSKDYLSLYEVTDDKAEKRRLQKIYDDQTLNRNAQAPRSRGLSVIKYFIELLDTQDETRRVLSILQLQVSIKEKNKAVIEAAEKKKNQLFEILQKNKKMDNNRDREAYKKAKNEYVDKVLNLEHLWRELSHIYMSEPMKHDHIPRLAALHLLDGFPLEILDGDAAIYSEDWVSRIVDYLNTVLKNPKVFVLSVMGLQSSGKSTLLNLMFGTQLRTSAGQCTRGVYLQLVKSDREEFDYLLLLDTEGLRAPEHHGLDNSEAHDNRLATFSVLPADACIILVSNEDDTSLRDVLPMVMLAFNRSKIADDFGGQMQSKIFFFYRSIDTTDTRKLSSSRQKLLDTLQESARQLSSISHTSDLESCKHASFLDFKIAENEEESDVKYLGNLKKSNNPPNDTPEWQYGDDVVKVREYIHKRVTQDPSWRPRTLQEWEKYLLSVWKCIRDSNFELSFKNTIEYSSHEKLLYELSKCRAKVAEAWNNEFELSTGMEEVKRFNKDEWLGLIRSKVNPTITKCDQEVKDFLNDRRYQKWKVEETKSWASFKLRTEAQWGYRIQDRIDGVMQFQKKLSAYTKKIKTEIGNMFEEKQIAIDRKDPKSLDKIEEEHFYPLFKRILEDAETNYEPLANKVEKNVNACYWDNNRIGKQYDLENERIIDFQLGKQHNITPLKLLETVGKALKRLRVEELNQKIVPILEGATQYQDFIVVNVIEATWEHIRNLKNTSKDDEASLHKSAKALVTKELKRKQDAWDKENNVRGKLEAEKENLLVFFRNRVKGLGGTDMLLSEMKDIFESKWLECFTNDILIPEFCEFVQQSSWVTNWKCWMAKLDLHLISLMENGRIDSMLYYMEYGNKHNQAVLDDELTKNWFKNDQQQNSWESFKGNFIASWNSATGALEKSKRKKISEFYKVLRCQILDFTKSAQLTNLLDAFSPTVYETYEEQIDYKEVGKKLCDLMKQKSPIQRMNGCILAKVKERMDRCQNESRRPRCLVRCPICGMSCFHPAGHSVKHDTAHQPKGLAGTIKVATKELVPESCAMSAELGRSFCGGSTSDKLWLYTDFDKCFTEWAPPRVLENFSSEIREHVFAHYQENLLKIHVDSRACTSIPAAYQNHNMKAVKSKLEHFIGKE